MNRSQRDYLFKIKTTNPKAYCVRPSLGLIERNKSLAIDVLYLGNDISERLSGTPSGKSSSDSSRNGTMSPSYRLSSESGSGSWNGSHIKNDKFLVLCLPSPLDLSDGIELSSGGWAKLEAEFRDELISKKIRVVFSIDDRGKGSPVVPNGRVKPELERHWPVGRDGRRQISSGPYSAQIMQYDVPLESGNNSILAGSQFIARNIPLLVFVLIVVTSLSILYY